MVLILQEGIARLEAEMAEERDKCQRMVDQIRREIEAQATEVRPTTIHSPPKPPDVHTYSKFFLQKCIDMMKRSVKEKGIQNRIMEKVTFVKYVRFDNLFFVLVYRRLNCIITGQRQ